MPIKKTLINPSHIINQAVDIFQNRLQSNRMSIEIDLEPAASDLQMIGDPDRLMQLFSNILENDADFLCK